GAVSAALGIAGIPTLSESTMLARDVAIAGYEGARVHFQHLSCAGSVVAIAGAKQRGLRVSAEVTPHHLLLSEEDVRTMDTRMKMYPPLAGAQDRRALIDGLRTGTIDCVASDHAPHAREEKEVPFEQAPMGTTGLETAFAALYTGLVLPGSLLEGERAVRVVVDVQDGFRPYDSFAGVAESCAKLVQAARLLSLPAIVSEQYPKGLGHTAPEVGITDEPQIEKTVFSAARADGFDLAGRDQAIVCGIAAHVCVGQTVHDLL